LQIDSTELTMGGDRLICLTEVVLSLCIYCKATYCIPKMYIPKVNIKKDTYVKTMKAYV
jgi:hypothetical protein